MSRFAPISAIDTNDQESWEGPLFLTIDIDWAPDYVLADSIALLERAGVAATWFVTHDTPLLNALRGNPKFELGIHPNFNPLLDGSAPFPATMSDVLDASLRIVPEATSVRSHSMTQSTPLLELFGNSGLTHDANHFIPYWADVTLRPWLHWNGLIRVPYLWEDDINYMRSAPPPISSIAERPGLKVFDFHPIHIFLNSEAPARYAAARGHLHEEDRLRDLVNRDRPGARDWLQTLMDAS